MPQFDFTPAELALYSNIPEGDLVELAAELDMAVPEQVIREELLTHIVVSLAQLARREGLPFSRYDKDDLEALPPEDFRALASLCGVSPDMRSFLKAGEKVYKQYRKQRPKSPVPLLLPTLLPSVARHARETEQG